MRAEETDVLVFDESLIEEFADLDRIIQFSDPVIFSAFVVFKYNDILYFLMPDRKVDCS